MALIIPEFGLQLAALSIEAEIPKLTADSLISKITDADSHPLKEPVPFSVKRI